jgi:hypothetical protein
MRWYLRPESKEPHGSHGSLEGISPHMEEWRMIAMPNGWVRILVPQAFVLSYGGAMRSKLAGDGGRWPD